MRRNLSVEDIVAGSLTKMSSSAAFPRTDSEQAFQVRLLAPSLPTPPETSGAESSSRRPAVGSLVVLCRLNLGTRRRPHPSLPRRRCPRRPRCRARRNF